MKVLACLFTLAARAPGLKLNKSIQLNYSICKFALNEKYV